MIDIPALKARIDLSQVVAHYTALQKRGQEYVGRCVAHSPDNNPSMYCVPAKGIVHCFACGFNTDVIGFIQHVEGCDFTKACELLGGTQEWQPTITAVPKIDRPNRVTAAPPLGEPAPDMTLRGLGRPSRVWCYRDAEALPIGYIARYDTEAGKEIRCWTWGAYGDEAPAWACGHWTRPRPLYGLDRLAKRATAPVLIVEGEKAADAAATLLPVYVVVTWPGGAESWDRTDLAPLAGRSVLLWPDEDYLKFKTQKEAELHGMNEGDVMPRDIQPGRKCMTRLAGVLADPDGLACAVSVLDTEGMPDGWDAADAAESMSTQAVIEWARPRKRVFQPLTPLPVEEPAHGEPSGTAIDPHPMQDDLPPPIDEPDYSPPASHEILPPAEAPRRQRPRLSVVGGHGGALPAVDEEALPLELSESGIAEEFAATNQGDMRYVPNWRRAGWLVWTGQRWQREDTRNSAMQRMRLLAHSLKYRAVAAALQPASRNKLESKQYCGNVLDLAEYDRRLLARPDQWDADPFLLGTPAGTVDLRTGDILEPLPEQWITRQTLVAPRAGPTPLFDSVMGKAADGDANMLDYLWRWLGYLLTGDVREESFLFLFGPPACGKTTLIEAVAAILGSVHDGGYAVKTSMDLFTESRIDRGAGRFHVLHGARFAHAAETEEGRHWKPAMMKEATGGDTMIGERKYENEFSFRPTHKILIHGNHRPHMRQADEGLRRRMQIVEYHAAVDESDRDPLLKQKLIAEYPAILFRMIKGCIDWQRVGLNPPGAIAEAVESYYEAEDSFGAWIDERVEVSPLARLPSGEAYQSFRTWLEDRGEHAPSHKRFTVLMQARGHVLKKSGHRYFDGLRLLPFSYLPQQRDIDA